jgi:hypothetical protein
MERKISPVEYLRLIAIGLLVTGSIFFLALFFISCDDEESPPQLAITSFSPTSGKVGTAVTINGTGFSETGAPSMVLLQPLSHQRARVSPQQFRSEPPQERYPLAQVVLLHLRPTTSR